MAKFLYKLADYTTLEKIPVEGHDCMEICIAMQTNKNVLTAA